MRIWQESGRIGSRDDRFFIMMRKEAGKTKTHKDIWGISGRPLREGRGNGNSGGEGERRGKENPTGEEDRKERREAEGEEKRSEP